VELSLTRERATDLPFEGFFTDEYPRLTRALYLLCGNRMEAEDLAQEALARTYERWDRVREMESPTGYVFTIALNLHRRQLRRTGVLARKLGPGPPGRDLVADADTRSDVMRALQAIPRDLRVALVLSEWLGMTSEEASTVMGIRPGSVRARLHRARAAFRDQLGEGYV
jgi:RNA polymerase sigma-70 factor (sigma-E family)